MSSDSSSDTSGGKTPLDGEEKRSNLSKPAKRKATGTSVNMKDDKTQIKKKRTLCIPTIQIKGKREVNENSDALFTATCTSGHCDNSKYRAKWQKIVDGKIENIDDNLEKYNGTSDVMSNLQFVIHSVSKSDEGTYQLMVKDKENGIFFIQFAVIVILLKDREEVLKFTELSVKLGTKALKEFFDSKVPPSQLESHLHPHKDDFRKKWKCTAIQMETLYPPAGQKVTSDNFDISVMYKVIRNTLNIPKPKQGWGESPLSSDTSEADDIERLRHHRNVLSHLDNLKIEDFEDKWEDLSQAINRLTGGKMEEEIKRIQNIKVEASDEGLSVMNDLIIQIFQQTKEIKQILSDSARCQESGNKQIPLNFTLCKLKRQRKCQSCQKTFERPPTVPNDYVLKFRKPPRSFYTKRGICTASDQGHCHLNRKCILRASSGSCPKIHNMDISLSKEHVDHYREIGVYDYFVL